MLRLLYFRRMSSEERGGVSFPYDQRGILANVPFLVADGGPYTKRHALYKQGLSLAVLRV